MGFQSLILTYYSTRRWVSMKWINFENSIFYSNLLVDLTNDLFHSHQAYIQIKPYREEDEDHPQQSTTRNPDPNLFGYGWESEREREREEETGWRPEMSRFWEQLIKAWRLWCEWIMRWFGWWWSDGLRLADELRWRWFFVDDLDGGRPLKLANQIIQIWTNWIDDVLGERWTTIVFF